MAKHSLRALALSLLMALMVGACGGPPDLAGFVREPAPNVGDRSLPDMTADGDDYQFVASDNGLLVVYFGYTYCPDVCPTTMSDIRSAVAELGDDGDRVEVAMATVDPNRDTPDVITDYVRAFFEDGHALRTEDDDRLSAVAGAFGAAYEVEELEDGTVEVLHTGHAYVVDDQGVLRVSWPFGTTEEDMASDLDLLLEEA
jgi:protein SCO1/2